MTTKENKPYDINVLWDSQYLCKKCGGLIYYNMETKKEHCFNITCQEYPTDIEIFDMSDVGLTNLYQQYEEIGKKLGQIVSTCDYDVLLRYLLEKRKNIVDQFFTTQIMNINDFLFLNDMLLFIQKYHSLGVRRDLLTFNAFIELFKQYSEHLKMIEDLHEGRYLLAKVPPNQIYLLKYYDVITSEIWSSYGLVNLQTKIDVNEFRYHEVIEKLIHTQDINTISDYALFFERFWAFEISFLYLVKRNRSTSLKYQYSVTPTDLANILSIVQSMKDNKLINVPIISLLKHFIAQPIRDRNINEFLDILTGKDDKIPIVIRTYGGVLLDRQTLLLFFILLHSQHLSSSHVLSGQKRMIQYKQKAGGSYEEYLKTKLEKAGYKCLSPSINIGGLNYDVIAISELKHEILLVETKFRDPSPSSLSANTLVQQEFVFEEEGLLPQVMRHQERFENCLNKGTIFHSELGLNNEISKYVIKGYFVTKYTPLISQYANIGVVSERQLFEDELSKLN